MLRGYVANNLYKPFVVNWSEMSSACVITARQKMFRTPEQANEFIRSLYHREGFIKINYIYCRDSAWNRTHYA